jgi:hypothetical protein
MKTRESALGLSAPAPALALGLALCFAFSMPANKLCSASAQVTSPNGSYGVLLNQWKDPSSNNVTATLGVLNFDGAGNVSGTYTIAQTKNQTAVTGTWTGTYSGNPDGSNTVNLTLDVGGTITLAVVVTDGGTGLQLLVAGGSLAKPGQVLNGTGRIQSSLGSIPSGNYGYLINQWPDSNNGPQGTFGLVYLDGAGNVFGFYTITGNTGASAPLTGTLKGTYSVNPDSTGSFSVTLDIGFSVTYSMVITDGGSGILMLLTGGTGGLKTANSGIARLQ